MNRVVTLVIVFGTLISRPSAAFAQATTAPPQDARASDQRCKDALPAGSNADGSNCRILATIVIDRVKNPPKKLSDLGINPSQPSITDTPGAQASAGQTAAVAPGQPVASSGGSVWAAGTIGQGLQLVTSLAINPGMLAVGDTDEHSVWLSRFTDISVVLPANVLAADGASKGFSYFGARLRLNLAAALKASSLESKQKEVIQKYAADATSARDAIEHAMSLLAQSTNPKTCASAIEAADLQSQQRECQGTLDVTVFIPTLASARQALAEFRAEADKQYLSLEARFDHGDLNADNAARKDSLLAAYLAGGYTFSPRAEGASLSVRGRGGAVYFQDGMTSTSKVAGFGALGVELGFARDLRRYSLSVGVELYSKQVTDDPMLALDERNAFKIGLALPVADGKTVSVGLTFPTSGGEPMIAVSGDWSALLDTGK